MAEITSYLDKISNNPYGDDVREAIRDAISAIHDATSGVYEFAVSVKSQADNILLEANQIKLRSDKALSDATEAETKASNAYTNIDNSLKKITKTNEIFGARLVSLLREEDLLDSSSKSILDKDGNHVTVYRVTREMVDWALEEAANSITDLEARILAMEKRVSVLDGNEDYILDENGERIIGV